MNTPFEISCCFCCADSGCVNKDGTEWYCYTVKSRDEDKATEIFINFPIQQCKSFISNGRTNFFTEPNKQIKVIKQFEIKNLF